MSPHDALTGASSPSWKTAVDQGTSCSEASIRFPPRAEHNPTSLPWPRGSDVGPLPPSPAPLSFLQLRLPHQPLQPLTSSTRALPQLWALDPLFPLFCLLLPPPLGLSGCSSRGCNVTSSEHSFLATQCHSGCSQPCCLSPDTCNSTYPSWCARHLAQGLANCRHQVQV